ncbi:hypothetical protein ACFVAD_18030 [Sutcliffiella sp. NPDC057660]|uniref:hypothetical protein n=1 Tax=Sutcliffiella sp. NPDC057660 TaxID=3346199 RepID=UPI00367506B1
MDFIFYGTIGLILLFLIIVYAVRAGIDTSQNMKALRSELEGIKRKLKDMKVRTLTKRKWNIPVMILRQLIKKNLFGQ